MDCRRGGFLGPAAAASVAQRAAASPTALAGLHWLAGRAHGLKCSATGRPAVAQPNTLTARARNRRFWRLRALRAHTKTPIQN
jgi:hypothetical protein